MIAFIDDHRGVHGVEPICKVLPIAPSTYRAHLAQRADPARLSARARRDAAPSTTDGPSIAAASYTIATGAANTSRSNTPNA